MKTTYYKLKNNALIKAKSVERINGVWVSNPTAEQYASIGAYPRSEESFAPPTTDEGFHAVPDGYELQDGKWVRKWRVEANPPQPIYISKAKVAEVVDSMGKTAEFFAWIGSRATYATGWYNGADAIAYDPTDNASDLASLIAALGVAETDVPALIEKVMA